MSRPWRLNAARSFGARYADRASRVPFVPPSARSACQPESARVYCSRVSQYNTLMSLRVDQEMCVLPSPGALGRSGGRDYPTPSLQVSAQLRSLISLHKWR